MKNYECTPGVKKAEVRSQIEEVNLCMVDRALLLQSDF